MSVIVFVASVWMMGCFFRSISHYKNPSPTNITLLSLEIAFAVVVFAAIDYRIIHDNNQFLWLPLTLGTFIGSYLSMKWIKS